MESSDPKIAGKRRVLIGSHLMADLSVSPNSFITSEQVLKMFQASS